MTILYRIEADMRFERRPCDPRQFDALVEQFNLPAATAASEIVKDNRLSAIVVARCGDKDVVFRRCHRELAAQVERQSRIFATLRGARVVRPLRANSGHHCYSDRRGAWITYRYVAGQIYCDASHPPFAAIEAALRCVVALTVWEKDHPAEAALLPAIERSSERWGDLAARLLDLRWRDAIGEETATLVADAAPAIRDLQRACSGAASDPQGLAHADLQPANIIAGPDGVTVIDLEDVCRDDVLLSAAHAIFKLTRHAVLLGVLSVERARSDLCARGLALAESLGIRLGGQDARRLAARRTLDDISNILCHAENPSTRWMLYDLRKKIHNLFELAELFGEPLAVKHVV
jgi:aminoglycoside phosphotransferase (APT) family kinase protein